MEVPGNAATHRRPTAARRVVEVDSHGLASAKVSLDLCAHHGQDVPVAIVAQVKVSPSYFRTAAETGQVIISSKPGGSMHEFEVLADPKPIGQFHLDRGTRWAGENASLVSCALQVGVVDCDAAAEAA
jgi:hypothetical protein